MGIPPIRPIAPETSVPSGNPRPDTAPSSAQDTTTAQTFGDSGTRFDNPGGPGANRVEHTAAAKASGPKDAAGAANASTTQAKSLDDINRHLAESALRVEFDTTAPPNQLWLNVIDQDTGAIVQKIPPEGTRRLLEDPGAKGIVIDKPR